MQSYYKQLCRTNNKLFEQFVVSIKEIYLEKHKNGINMPYMELHKCLCIGNNA